MPPMFRFASKSLPWAASLIQVSLMVLLPAGRIAVCHENRRYERHVKPGALAVRLHDFKAELLHQDGTPAAFRAVNAAVKETCGAIVLHLDLKRLVFPVSVQPVYWLTVRRRYNQGFLTRVLICLRRSLHRQTCSIEFPCRPFISA